MTWNYAYTSQIWPSVCIILLLVALAIYTWRRRKTPGALPFIIACLFAAAWAAGSVMEYAAVDWTTKIFWVKFQASWQMPLVTSIICFSLEYAWPRRWLTRRNLALFSLPSLVVLGLILMDHLNHVMWRRFAFLGSVQPQLAPVGWLAVVCGLVISWALNLIVFGWLFLHSPQHRWPVAFMLVGQFGGRLFYLAERINLLHSILPIDLIGVAFEFLMYAIALFGFQILDPIPLARRIVIAQMREGMLVLDPQDRVVSLNPAAVAILGSPAKLLLGRPIRDLLATLPDLSEPLASAAASADPIEMSLGAGAEARGYELDLSPLRDWRGLLVGRLLLLRDVTEQKRAQAQLLEQQRSLATLRERTRLARELHDSLGQTLAAAHLQASSARLLLARGEIAQTDECLASLADMTIDAEADVREYLLGLKNFVSTGLPFFPALRQYLAQFSQKYDLPVELCAPAQLEAEHLPPAVELQLRRIIEEALSNVRKHACAKSAQVGFSVLESMLQITIRDDGQGFDPAAVATPLGEGFGLQTMRERAEALGGCLEVISQPGKGTQVVAQVPVGERGGEESYIEAEVGI
jgi:PAS domain S-box-containing protein